MGEQSCPGSIYLEGCSVKISAGVIGDIPVTPGLNFQIPYPQILA
jgi:hypothetical protein